MKCTSATLLFCLLLSCFAASLTRAKDTPDRGQQTDLMAKCWQDLAAADAEVAYRAKWRLVQNPEAALPFLAEHLKAAVEPDIKQIQAWLGDLASPTFAVRDKANRALELAGELAEPALRKALEASTNLEMRQRVQLLLGKLDQAVIAPEKLRQLRAIEALENIGGAKAKEILDKLANGFSDHRQTREAQETLKRMKERLPAPDRWLASVDSPADPLPFGARMRFASSRFRHQGIARQCVFSPDGRLIISHDQYAVYFWDRQTGKLERKLGLAVTCLAVAPQGNLMAFGLAAKKPGGGAVVYQDWQNDKEVSRWELPAGVEATQLTFSADGGRVCFKGSDDHLRAWDIKSGQQSTLWQPSEDLQKLLGFSPDGLAVVAGSKKDTVFFNFQKNHKQALPGLERGARQVVFSPDGRYMVLFPESSEAVQICDGSTGKLLWLSARSIGTGSACFSADGKVLAIGASQSEISLLDLQTGKHLKDLPQSYSRRLGAISPDGRWGVSPGQVLTVWNLETGQVVHERDGHVGAISGLAISPYNDWIVTYDDREAHLWDPQTGKHKLLVETGGYRMRVAAVSPDGKWLAAAHPGPGAGYLRIWETATGRLVYTLPAHSQRQYGRFADVRFSRDSRYLFSWGDDDFLRKWDIQTGKAVLEVLTEVFNLDPLDELDFRLAEYGWSADGERLMLLGHKGDLHSFDANTGKEGPLVNLVGTNNRSFCFSLSAMYVAISGFDPGVPIHDLKSGKPAFQLSLPEMPREHAFSPDGRTLVVVTPGSTMFFEIATRKVRMTIPARAKGMAFCLDGRYLATGMDDSTALVWDLALLAEGKKG